jgi:hypothetical protein
MPSQFTSQIKIVPDQEQQHISIGLESLSRNLTKIQALKDMDDQAKMDQFNKLVDVSLEDFWQRDKDELYQGEQDYLASVAQAYKDYGKESILPYQYQSKLDKEKSELMMKLEQSKADAEWYKGYMKQVSGDKTGRVDVEGSVAPLAEWMKLSISERAKIDKSQWFKLKEEEINLTKEIGDIAKAQLKKVYSEKLIYDKGGNIKWKESFEGVPSKYYDSLAENIMGEESLMREARRRYKDPAVQQQYPIFKDYVKSFMPPMGQKKTISGFGTGEGEKTVIITQNKDGSFYFRDKDLVELEAVTISTTDPETGKTTEANFGAGSITEAGYRKVEGKRMFAVKVNVPRFKELTIGEIKEKLSDPRFEAFMLWQGLNAKTTKDNVKLDSYWLPYDEFEGELSRAGIIFQDREGNIIKGSEGVKKVLDEWMPKEEGTKSVLDRYNK